MTDDGERRFDLELKLQRQFSADANSLCEYMYH